MILTQRELTSKANFIKISHKHYVTSNIFARVIIHKHEDEIDVFAQFAFRMNIWVVEKPQYRETNSRLLEYLICFLKIKLVSFEDAKNYKFMRVEGLYQLGKRVTRDVLSCLRKYDDILRVNNFLYQIDRNIINRENNWVFYAKLFSNKVKKLLLLNCQNKNEEDEGFRVKVEGQAPEAVNNNLTTMSEAGSSKFKRKIGKNENSISSGIDDNKIFKKCKYEASNNGLIIKVRIYKKLDYQRELEFCKELVKREGIKYNFSPFSGITNSEENECFKQSYWRGPFLDWQRRASIFGNGNSIDSEEITKKISSDHQPFFIARRKRNAVLFIALFEFCTKRTGGYIFAYRRNFLILSKVYL